MLMKKLILSALMSVFIMTVSAAGVLAADFDPHYYAQRYPDVANTIGCDETALYQHYLTIGQNEGYYPTALAECEGHAKKIELQNAKATGNNALVEALTPAPAANTQAVAKADASPVTAVPSAVIANPVTVPATTDQPIGLYGTYVDVDVANQTMTYFVNNLPVLSSPCVTGTPKNNRSTPKGAFYIMEKIPGKRLKGDTWDVWVDRWMKFTSDSCGLHDASWRKKFGGNIYKSNGSHGCVNLPKDIAYRLYDMVAVGTPVIVH
jgi:lipoprotein-anchoring transpeptidase ErfK/SrfK